MNRIILFWFALWVVPMFTFAQAIPSKAEIVNISGIWDLQVTIGDRTPSPLPVAQIKQKGSKLTGTYRGHFGEASLQGSVNGDDVVFSILITAGKEKLTLSYSGKVIDVSHMKGKVTLTGYNSDGTWSAKKRP